MRRCPDLPSRSLSIVAKRSLGVCLFRLRRAFGSNGVIACAFLCVLSSCAGWLYFVSLLSVARDKGKIPTGSARCKLYSLDPPLPFFAAFGACGCLLKKPRREPERLNQGHPRPHAPPRQGDKRANPSFPFLPRRERMKRTDAGWRGGGRSQALRKARDFPDEKPARGGRDQAEHAPGISTSGEARRAPASPSPFVFLSLPLSGNIPVLLSSLYDLLLDVAAEDQ